MTQSFDAASTAATLETGQGDITYYRLDSLAREAGADLTRMPFTVKVLLENVLRLAAAGQARAEEVLKLARWTPGSDVKGEFPFLPARVLLQDFTGVPAVVDLAAMRAAMHRL